MTPTNGSSSYPTMRNAHRAGKTPVKVCRRPGPCSSRRVLIHARSFATGPEISSKTGPALTPQHSFYQAKKFGSPLSFLKPHGKQSNLPIQQPSDFHQSTYCFAPRISVSQTTISQDGKKYSLLTPRYECLGGLGSGHTTTGGIQKGRRR